MTPYDVIVHLSLIHGVGPASIKQIVDNFAQMSDLVCLYTMHISDLMHRCGLTETIAHLVVQGLKDARSFEQERLLLERHAIHAVTVLHDTYPALLKSIYVPPAVLYYKGTLPTDSDTLVAIVGARKATSYGLDAVKMLVPSLVHHGVTIVSGGALGIDQYAHDQTIKAGGKTIAVLGSGLLCLYPASNRRLFDAIVQSGGALISPFSLRMEAMPGHFPARNRIIAGLSQGTVVVQAAKKSGALITARYALEQGRELCAVPGPINAELSQGCHDLIKEGAVLVSQAEDILQAIALPVLSRNTESTIMSNQASDSLLEACVEPLSVDELVSKTGLSLEELHTRLFQLQLNGVIEQDFMGCWRRI